VLRYFDDLAVRDIAQALGLSEGAVKRYLSDGTRRLRRVLALAEPDPGAEETVHVTDLRRAER
jgi:RNA polymerase sigma-70 factor (ECF subfamily)